MNNCRAETETSSSLAYVSYENPKYEQDLAPLVIQVAVISPFFSLPFFSLPFLLHPAILQSSILTPPCHSSVFHSFFTLPFFTLHPARPVWTKGELPAAGQAGSQIQYYYRSIYWHNCCISTEVFIGITAVFIQYTY